MFQKSLRSSDGTYCKAQASWNFGKVNAQSFLGKIFCQAVHLFTVVFFFQVASLDFTLEDYDLSDDVVANLKSSEMLKREDNEANIRNNLLVCCVLSSFHFSQLNPLKDKRRVNRTVGSATLLLLKFSALLMQNCSGSSNIT